MSTITEPEQRERLALDSFQLTTDFLLEISHISLFSQRCLAHVLVLLEKEAAGYPPLFALDFEVLHSYLFPSLQSHSSRVPPAMARYIIDTCPTSMVLPPGTITEFLRFAQKTFPAIERFETIITSQPSYKLSTQQAEELISIYKEITRDPTASAPLISRYDSLAFILSEYFSGIISGFRVLHNLITNGKIVALSDEISSLDAILAADSGLANTLRGRLVARREGQSRRNPYSDDIDAQNLALTLKIDRLQQLSFSRRNETLTYHVATPLPPKRGVTIQLLTQTKPILTVDMRDFSGDTIAVALKILPHIVAGRNHPWFVCPTGTAAIYCSIRSSCSTVHEAVIQVKDYIKSLTALQAVLVDVENAQSRLDAARDDGDLLRELAVFFDEGFGRTYVKLRPVLTNSLMGEHFRLTSQLLHTRDENDPEIDVFAYQDTYRTHLFEHSKLKYPSNDSVLSIYHVKFFEAKYGVNNDRCLCSELLCTLTAESLLRIDSWPALSLDSIRIPIICDLNQLVDKVNACISSGFITQPKVTARYDISPSDDGQPADYVIHDDTHLSLITVPALIKPGISLGSVDSFVFPSRLTISAKGIDLHVTVPGSGDPSQFVIVNVCGLESPEPILGIWLEHHPWKFSENILNRITEVIASTCKHYAIQS